MRICLVMIAAGWGGAENVAYSLAKKLREKVNVFVLLNSEIAGHFSGLTNVRIFRVSSLFDTSSLVTSILFRRISHGRKSGWTFGPFFLLNELLRHLYYERIRKDILRIVIQQRIDIIHLHGNHSLKMFLPLFKELDVPTVFTVHGAKIFGQPELLARARERVMLVQGLTKVNKITCVSEYIGKILESSRIPISSVPVIIRNGIDVEEIRENARVNVSGNSLPGLALKGEFKLFFPGGAKPWKGGDLLMKSLPRIKKEIPDVHLYVAGAVRRKHMLRNLVEEKKLEHNVTFMGFLPPRRYYQVLSSTDLLVCPSKTEAFGLVLLEAMALGKPIVATRAGAIPEVVTDTQNGLLVKRDPDSIADAVVRLYESRDLYEKISQNNLRNVELFDWDNIIGDYVQLYKTLSRHS